MAKRIAVMYKEDKKLNICSGSKYLANANYKPLIKGYENMFDIAFGFYKGSLNIDLSKLEFTEHHFIENIYDDGDEMIQRATLLENDKTKKLVKYLDKDLQM